MKALSLYELNNLVRETIAVSLTDEYWVEAELSELREVRGHCYMELIQKDLFSNTPVAKAQAKCWKSKWIGVRDKFERIAGQYLHAGLKVMLKVYPDFHEAYGFSWIVTDVNPEFTMGDMARKRLEIINKLKTDGVFDLQKDLQIPMFAQRIAVISSANAAGYGDFCNQLENNDYGLKFYPRLFPAIMQGEGIEKSVISALDDIYKSLDDFDVVVIIRGGGATSDMSGFDTLALAENVANFPLPIITGIGHERDESVLDMVSNTRVKTPTAAAALLIEHLSNVYNRVMDAQEEIISSIVHRMEVENIRLKRLAEKIPMLFSIFKNQQISMLDKLFVEIVNTITQKVSMCTYDISILSKSLAPVAQKRLTKESYRLQLIQQKLEALDPVLLLKRGYSITTFKGKVIKNASALKSGDEVETRLDKGTVKSIIK
ncbi:exodeoxyribonuclease VII large subunit [Segatella paludivivens]|uniref:exodeoxyribonuclease VII large subunit n=1 Tax=Segatella paludivivens TaxID=185294 RepID=UPI00035DD23C|nr:exodeoxyribonuclease VII large subunit [Segatella paludivivens]